MKSDSYFTDLGNNRCQVRLEETEDVWVLGGNFLKRYY
jgi:hypothetical protein